MRGELRPGGAGQPHTCSSPDVQDLRVGGVEKLARLQVARRDRVLLRLSASLDVQVEVVDVVVGLSSVGRSDHVLNEGAGCVVLRRGLVSSALLDRDVCAVLSRTQDLLFVGLGPVDDGVERTRDTVRPAGQTLGLHDHS